MENASKALIIAGAILISILLISVGIIVMNSINDPIDQAGGQAKGQAVEMFNSKFTGYAGDQKSSAVKALMTSIQSSNGTDKAHEISAKVGKSSTMGVTGTTASTANIATIQANLNSQKTYNIQFGYDGDGYINSVTVTEK